MSTKKLTSLNWRAQRGLSLIELMIAMLLGLLVVGAAGGMFLSNKRVYGSTETLGRIQENQRTAFEIMSRDLREAGGNPCGSASEKVFQIPPNTYLDSYAKGLEGYGGADVTAGTPFGTAAGQRVAGTEAVDVHLTTDSNIRITRHDNPSATLQVNSNAELEEDDVVMACNMAYSLIFEVTGLPSGEIQHNGGGTGNCASEFQWSHACQSGGASGSYGYCFMVTNPATASTNCKTAGTNYGKYSDTPAQVVKLYTSRWYVGNNGRGGRSLYRAILQSNGTATPAVKSVEEIAEGVGENASPMSLTYLVAGNSARQAVAAVRGANTWTTVTAVNVSLTFQGTQGALEGDYVEGTDNQALDRTVTNFVMLRNREDKLL